MDSIITAPMFLDSLDNECVRFSGIGEQKSVEPTMFGGEREVVRKFPYLLVSREHWEAMGRPTGINVVVYTEITPL